MDLDVGCGFSLHHRQRVDCLKVDIQRSGFADMICDACNLPFRDKTFDKVFCSHVLEHLVNPIKALKEILRVSNRYAFVEVPHWLSRNAKQDSKNPHDKHISSFRCNWFHRALRNFPHHVEVKYRFPLYLYIQCEIYQY